MTVQLKLKDNLDRVDVKVLEGLALHDPRNKTKLAANLRIPRRTLGRRIKRLNSRFSLYVQGNIYHTNIGLRKVFLIVTPKPGLEELVYQCLKSNDYWLYVSQGIGTPSCIATYGIPAGKEKAFEGFVNKLTQHRLLSDLKLFWSTCIHNVNTTSTWFDTASEKWTFQWDSWVKELPLTQGELPYTLKEAKEYPQEADWIDIMILKELEKNYTIKMQEIAKQLDTSLQVVRYHYEKHVLGKGMLEGPQILADHYKGLSPDTLLFMFSFENSENLTRFARSLMNKPFARALGKVYGKNQMFTRLYLPREQLRPFLAALSKLVRTEFLQTYEYIIEDSNRAERQTISYEFFKDGDWEYQNENYLRRLESIVKRQRFRAD
jgi:DNA-binding Lrp family transcriptional regulator